MLEPMKEKLKDRDFATIARNVVEQAIGERLDGAPLTVVAYKSKDAKAVIRGRLGGLKGGKARAKKLSSQKRKHIAKIAAKARWKK
jgi:hypothetical protein